MNSNQQKRLQLPVNPQLSTGSARFDGYRLDNDALLHSLSATCLPTVIQQIAPATTTAGISATGNDSDEYLKYRWYNWHLVSRRQQLVPHQQGMIFVDAANGHLYRIEQPEDSIGHTVSFLMCDYDQLIGADN